MLEQFEHKLIAKMLLSPVLHADETGINIGGKNHWLHCLSNPQWTLYYDHAKRGSEAMAAMNVLPRFTGILCHDHWKPYFQFNCLHALCNAHYLRELTYAEEQEQQAWAKHMRELLLDIEQAVKAQEVHYPNHKLSAIPNNTGRYSNKPRWNVRLPTRKENPVNAGGLNAAKHEIYWSDY